MLRKLLLRMSSRRTARRAYRQMWGWPELLHSLVIDRRVDHAGP